MSLQTEDSVLPVTCNGPGHPVAPQPFLYAPYRGWTSIVSYFDHDMPNFEVDGTILTATGDSAAPDGYHQGIGFPAYWNSSLRQYLYYDGHNGYDFDLWFQPVYAAAAGKVIFAAYEYPTMPDHGYGKMVMIDHGNGYVTLYGHFSRILVKKGEKVQRGQRIGISGDTGHSTGPHLHFTVFHNCSPTDPYGWSGSGADPLQSFQGESSEFLWRRAPLVANPLRDWPSLDGLPAASVTRIALLRLPPAARGLKSFTAALSAEVARDASTLRARGLFVQPNVLKGALTITGTSTAQEIYALHDVVSITTPDTEEGDGDDVLHSLALAARATRHARMTVARSSAWKGFLLRWRHRTFLVGTGVKGGDVDLHLDEHGRQVAVHHLHADKSTGAFAADLGKLSRRQTENLTRELEGRGSGGSTIVPRAKLHRQHAARLNATGHGPPWSNLLTPALLLGLAALVVAVRGARASLARRRSGAA